MNQRKYVRYLLIISLLFGIFRFSTSHPVRAETGDEWWNQDWPYRVGVTVDSSSIVAAQLDFSQLFDDLGLVDALLDVRSIRVVPYQAGIPQEPVPYQETYSELLIDADTLPLESSGSEPYWVAEEDTLLVLDTQRFIQGTGAIHAQTVISEGSNDRTGFSYRFNLPAGADWSDYETLLYDVWAEVNASAVDQTPDVFRFSLDGMFNCIEPETNGPALALDQWTLASIPLKPYGKCAEPDMSALQSFRFFLKVNRIDESGYYDPGDVVDLWLDHFRLVDQDAGGGEIRWQGEEGIDRYYIYFDTLNHEGHPAPDLVELTEPVEIASITTPESGGYFHLVSNATLGDLTVWSAPPVEKIMQTTQAPVATRSLTLSAARGEFEPIQLVVRSPVTQELAIHVSDFTHESAGATLSGNFVRIFRVDYVDLERISDHFGRIIPWPDPLYPISAGDEVTFTTEINQPLWFRFEVPLSAVPGIYHGEIRVGDAVVPVELHVWGFTLPTTSSLLSHVGLDYASLMETYGGTIDGVQQDCYQDLRSAIDAELGNYRLMAVDTTGSATPPDGLLYSLTAYEITQAQREQVELGTQVWWEFAPDDLPPLPNPAVIDRPGVEARYLPWLVWLDRVDGLYYPQIVDWDPDPWGTPFSNDLSNGNGFFFYPPRDNTLEFNPCDPDSIRLVPSIRLELLREGLEDYAYFRLLNGGDPEVGQVNAIDPFVSGVIESRTLFNRVPSAADTVRMQMAAVIEARQTHIFLPLLLR